MHLSPLWQLSSEVWNSLLFKSQVKCKSMRAASRWVSSLKRAWQIYFPAYFMPQIPENPKVTSCTKSKASSSRRYVRMSVNCCVQLRWISALKRRKNAIEKISHILSNDPGKWTFSSRHSQISQTRLHWFA